MIYIQGKDRSQCYLFTDSLDTAIDADNEVRLIDLFVESINLADFEFKLKTKTLEGRPPTHNMDATYIGVDA